MDIAVWLRSLSLEQYEAAFRENAIDADVLHDLTDQDLEKLGVLLGHRRRLLRAIAALDGTVATSSDVGSHVQVQTISGGRSRRRSPSCNGDVL